MNIIGDIDIIKVNISNSSNDSVAFEIKFNKSISIADLKKKLEIITGGNAGTMRLELYKGDRLVEKIERDEALLGSYPIDNGMRIHVVDNFNLIAEDVVEKFELTDQQYDQKGDSVRSFLKRNRLGKYNEEEKARIDEQNNQKQKFIVEQSQKCIVGARCQVKVEGKPTRRGTVMYNGELDGKSGIFIGIKYDEPLGKNDGTVCGKRYFECLPNYGGFVSPLSVEVGDFPPEDDDLNDEI